MERELCERSAGRSVGCVKRGVGDGEGGLGGEVRGSWEDVCEVLNYGRNGSSTFSRRDIGKT